MSGTVSLREASRLLGVPYATLYRAVEAGRVPATKEKGPYNANHKIRISLSFIASQQQATQRAS